MEDALLAEMAALPPLEDALEVFGVARAAEPDPLGRFQRSESRSIARRSDGGSASQQAKIRATIPML